MVFAKFDLFKLWLTSDRTFTGTSVTRRKGNVHIRAQQAGVAHQAMDDLGFCSMKGIEISFLLPPGWGASPSQGYP